MEKQFQNGMWPVMLTPLQQNGDVDYPALEELINWYIKEGSAGLFAVCQSSEMFYLSKEEREELTRFIKKYQMEEFLLFHQVIFHIPCMTRFRN